MAKEKPEFIRLSVYEVAILGGKDALPENEQGPLDLNSVKEHPLYDERLKKIKISPEWIDNLAHNGIKVAPEVAYLNAETLKPDPKGVPVIVDGRERIRGGRLASKRDGKDLTSWFKVVTLDEKELLGDMISLNIHHEDSTSTKIAKAKRYLELHKDDSEALGKVARAFGVKVATINMWLAYDKTAIPAVKKAVDSGKIPAVTGFDIARSGNAEVQETALAAVLALGTKDTETGARAGQAGKAKRAIAEATGKGAAILDKKTIKKIIALVADVQLPKGAKDEERGWWGGVQDALEFIVGVPMKELSEDAKKLAKLVKQLDSEKPSDSTPQTAKPKEGKSKGKGTNPTEETPPDDEE